MRPRGNLIIEKLGNAREFFRRRDGSVSRPAFLDPICPNRCRNGRKHNSSGARRRDRTEYLMSKPRRDNYLPDLIDRTDLLKPETIQVPCSSWAIGM
jgi:hypothetical protein